MSIVLPHPPSRAFVSALSALLFAAPIVGAQPTDVGVSAQVRAEPALRPVLVVYSQHRMSQEQWAALFTALRANLPEAVAELPTPDANPEFIRGDYYAGKNPGGDAITVYLHGDCLASVQQVPSPGRNRLGWVNQVGGRILPIIHVECTPIGEEISGRTHWMNHNQRITAMSDAIARVVLHEWVHVATQSAAHGADGITKAGFGVNDLLCGDQVKNCGPNFR
jgi:hypothetical protein